MRKSRTAQLVDAQRARTMVRITSRFEQLPIRGYVRAVGPRFFALELVSDRIRFDGFECLRISDLSVIAPDPYSAFAEAALKMRGEVGEKKARIQVGNIESILKSANQAFPLISIHREKVDPNVCQIGKVVKVGRGKVSLLEIRPNATWRMRPDEYRLSEITRVSFGGDYEDALHIVGGVAKLGSLG